MKQILLLVLALGMFSNNVSSQTKKSTTKRTVQAKITKSKPQSSKDVKKVADNVSREYHKEEDGMEWYKVCKNGKWGVEDKDGKILVPIENSWINYSHSQGFGPGFEVKKNDDAGYYSPNGELVIPFSRHYRRISKVNTSAGTYYSARTEKELHLVLCNESGEEVCQIDGYRWINPYYQGGKFFYIASLGEFQDVVLDGNGNQIFGPGKYIGCAKDGNFYDKLAEPEPKELGSLSSISTTINPFAKTVRRGITYTSSSSSSNSSNNNNSSSSTNSKSGTSTINVEHHRDPVPVQEWVQCTACWGSTICPNCAGSGTTYIGSNLHRCSRCGGRKICTSCSGKGGRYITVYK